MVEQGKQKHLIVKEIAIFAEAIKWNAVNELPAGLTSHFLSCETCRRQVYSVVKCLLNQRETNPNQLLNPFFEKYIIQAKDDKLLKEYILKANENSFYEEEISGNFVTRSVSSPFGVIAPPVEVLHREFVSFAFNPDLNEKLDIIIENQNEKTVFEGIKKAEVSKLNIEIKEFVPVESGLHYWLVYDKNNNYFRGKFYIDAN